MHNTKLECHLTEPYAFPYMVSIFIYILMGGYKFRFNEIFVKIPN